MFAYAKTLASDVLDTNGDAFLAWQTEDQNYMVLMVADSVGSKKGMPNTGTIVCDIVLDFLKKGFESDPDITIPEIGRILDSAFFAASRTVRTLNAIDPRYQELYASLACVVVAQSSKQMVYRSIGNVEIRIWNNRGFPRLNRLFTEAAEDVENGKTREQDYYTQPNRNILTSAFGQMDRIRTDSTGGTFQEGNLMFIATDGFYDFLLPNDIIATAAKENDAVKTVDALIEKIKENENRDNATLMCIISN